MQLVNSHYRVVEFDIPPVEHDEKYEQFGLTDPNDKRYGVVCKWFFLDYYVCDFESGFLTTRKITKPTGEIKISYRHTLQDAIALCEYCVAYDTPCAALGRVKDRVRKLFKMHPVHQTFTLEDAKAELALQMLSKETQNV